ncbi:MAG: hypothetical protein EOO11_07670 [Chitinophagaceae bacterium]|nr:MAG: hypothetical protein EOO11_07670 [Chitinophagaceae bacterium]
MKNFIRLFIALVALFTLQSVSAQNAKWTKGPTVSGSTITGMATGLGSGPFEVQIQGQYDCVNKGSNTPGSANWSNLNVYIPIDPKKTGGNFKISVTIPSQCDHANWTFLTRNLSITLYQNGQVVIPSTPVQ